MASDDELPSLGSGGPPLFRAHTSAFPILVSLSSGGVVQIEVTERSDVAEVKRLIGIHTGQDASEFQLEYCGQLLDDFVRVSDVGIVVGAEVRCIVP